MYWEQAWLNYTPVEMDKCDRSMLACVAYTVGSNRIDSAIEELSVAVRKMLSIEMAIRQIDDTMVGDCRGICLQLVSQEDHLYGDESYGIEVDKNKVLIKAKEDTGILYGVFELIRGIACQKPLISMVGNRAPKNPLRMLNHWDNSDGSIERGYSGQSFFFRSGELIVDERIKDYARLVASIGINGVVINNVNVAKDAIELITERYFDKLKDLMKVFDDYGIRLFLSLDYAASMDIGGLSCADPLDQEVIAWWDKTMAKLYGALPNFGGFLIKADSEGRPGPFTYNRSHAEGANMLARAVKPYGGSIIWRCFVYNCRQDWRDEKTDRARAQYDHFKPLDGEFDDNVALQIKNGPMDFQVREPVSPLFGAMPKTNQILEVQIAQEYTGQQRHVCYLIPMWKEILEFKTYCSEQEDLVKNIVAGETFNQRLCGIAAVTNMGDDPNWTGHDLAAANLYGYGRLTWDTDLSAEEIGEEWVRCTFGNDQETMNSIMKILMMSWPAYEKYTSPLGIGWMVNPSHHYGPNVDGYEYDRWGTYHRSDHEGMGIDRTDSGTGYVQQYFGANRECYSKVESCPEALLLFFHRISYKHVLSTGKILIQHIYDTHFEGVEDVKEMVGLWKGLEGSIDHKRHQRVTKRLAHQLEHSKEWRDVVNSYYYRKSYIQDEKGRKIY